MVLDNDTELVVNLCPVPPPPREAIPERNRNSHRKKPDKSAAIIACPEDAASHTRLVQIKLQVANAADREKPSNFIVLQSNEDVLRELDSAGYVLAAFNTEHGFLDQLPQGRMKDVLTSLTGQPGRTCIKLDHIQNSDMVYKIVRRSSTGARKVDKMLVEGIEPSSLNMRNDYDSKIYTGAQAPSFKVVARDLYDIENGYAIMGPSYPWDHQYVHDIVPATFKRLFLDIPLPGLEDDGTKVGDVLHFNDPAGKAELDILSGYSKTAEDDIVLAGEHMDIPVRTSMGVSFTFDQLPPSLRDAVSGGGNPSLATCHGFVFGMKDTHDDGTALKVRIILTRDNLPSFLKWPRLPQEAVFQSNLVAAISARCVVSAFRIVAVQFHPLAGFIPEDQCALGTKPSQPIKRDVYVAGHLDFARCAFISGEESGIVGQRDSEAERMECSRDSADWRNRHSNERYHAFALLSDFCARGGSITDNDFAEYHAPWKERFLERTRRNGGRYLPKVALACITSFPASAALATIHKCARLLGCPGYGPYLFELRSAVRRFAMSKTRRIKYKGPALSVATNLPGAVLMQLVHEYAKDASVVFKEGTVEAVVDLFESSKYLIGGDNPCDHQVANSKKCGCMFNFEGFGMVEIFAPITFRWVLYNPRKNPEDANIGVEGFTEIIFSKYMAKDRHGADLAGELNSMDSVRDAEAPPVGRGALSGGGAAGTGRRGKGALDGAQASGGGRASKSSCGEASGDGGGGLGLVGLGLGGALGGGGVSLSMTDSENGVPGPVYLPSGGCFLYLFVTVLLKC